MDAGSGHSTLQTPWAERDGSGDGLPWARREAVLTLARLMEPLVPHLAQEIHILLHPGDTGLLYGQPWPVAEAALVAVQSVTLAVQVMGKLRATLTLPPGTDRERAFEAAEADPNVARLLEGRRIVKRIHVPDRIVNFVVAD